MVDPVLYCRILSVEPEGFRMAGGVGMGVVRGLWGVGWEVTGGLMVSGGGRGAWQPPWWPLQSGARTAEVLAGLFSWVQEGGGRVERWREGECWFGEDWGLGSWTREKPSAGLRIL